MRAVVFVLLASVLFGTTGTAQALGATRVDALTLGAARVVIGGAALAAVALALARRASAGAPAVRPRLDIAAVSAVAVGAFGVVAYQPAFFLGTGRNGVAVGTVVALGSAPVLTGALSWAIGRRFPGRRWLVATAVAVAGLALLASAAPTGGTSGGIDTVGLLGSLGAGLAYAVYTLASKRLLDVGWSGPATMGSVFGAAAVLALPALVAADTAAIVSSPALPTVLWLGLGTVAAAYLLFAAGLRALSAATVSTLTLAEPLTAALLGTLLLGERLAPGAWLGVAAIALGIVVLVLPRRRTPAGNRGRS